MTQFGEIDVADVVKQPVPAERKGHGKVISLTDIFIQNTLDGIRSKDNIDELAKYAIDTYKKNERSYKNKL